MAVLVPGHTRGVRPLLPREATAGVRLLSVGYARSNGSRNAQGSDESTGLTTVMWVWKGSASASTPRSGGLASTSSTAGLRVLVVNFDQAVDTSCLEDLAEAGRGNIHCGLVRGIT